MPSGRLLVVWQSSRTKFWTPLRWSVIKCVLLAFFSDYYNLILIVSSALDWVLKGICSLFLICNWVKTKHLYIYLLSTAQHFQKLAKLERQSLFKCVYVTNIFMINWIPSLSYIFIMVRHLLFLCCKKYDAFSMARIDAVLSEIKEDDSNCWYKYGS